MFSLGFEKKKNQISPKSLLSIKQTSVQKKKFPGMLSKTIISKPTLGSPFEFLAYFRCVCDCAGLFNNKIRAERTDKLI